jgi:hypothetical protein
MLQPRGSEAEAPAEAEHPVAQLAALFGVEVLLAVALLERRQSLLGASLR